MEGNYDAAIAAVGLGFYAVYMIVMLAICVLTIVALWKVFVKAGKTNSELINGLKVRDKLLISASDIMMGYHVSAPNNLLTINTILELIEGDITTYNKLIGSNEYCYFIEFKLVPNCNIHGAYEQSKVAEFVNPFVTKIADIPKSNIVVPNHNKVIV